MTRLVLAWVLLLAATDLSGQATVSPRFGCRPGSCVGTPTPDAPPTLNITSPNSSGASGVSATPGALGGNANDDLGLSSVTCVNDRGGSCVVTNTFTWTASVVLSSGTNVITVTATDTSMQTTQAQFTFEYTPPPVDTPTVAISTNNGMAITTTSGTQTLQGTCTGTVSCTGVTYAIDGGNSVNCSLNTTLWTCSAIPLTVAAHTVVVSGTNGTLTGTDSIGITRTASDNSLSVTITCISNSTTPCADPFVTSTNEMDIAFSATAANGVAEVRCGTDDYTDNASYIQGAARQYQAPPTGAVVGPVTGVAGNLHMMLGTNHYKCWVRDTATPPNTASSAAYTATYSKDAYIITTTAPPIQSGVAMTPWDLIPDGGNGTYAWVDNTTGNSTVTCPSGITGLTITDTAVGGINVGRLAGTPSTTGTCNATIKLTSNFTTTTRTIPITVQAGAIPAWDAHWTTMNGLATKVAAGTVKLTTQSEVNSVTNQTSNPNNTSIIADGSTNYALITWPTNTASLAIGNQLKPTTNYSDGKVLFQFDFMWEDSWLPYNCRPGGRNVFYDLTQQQKTFNLYAGSTGNAATNTIYFEMDHGYTQSTTDCATIGTISIRENGQGAGNPAGATGGPSNFRPTGSGALSASTYATRPNVWYTVTMEQRINKPNTDFALWEASAMATLTAGNYQMDSAWIQSENETAPSIILCRVPHLQTPVSGGVLDKSRSAVIELNTSDAAGVTNSAVSLHMRIRNMTIQRNLNFADDTNCATAATDTTVFQAPTR